ncbi:MAG: hypothetical protein K0S80_1097 [Neobacillus sp.]|nr:hypothetical protein [Neobacillus sp.]
MIIVEWDYEEKHEDNGSIDSGTETVIVNSLKELDMTLEDINENFNCYNEDIESTIKVTSIKYYKRVQIDNPRNLLKGAC